MRILQVTPVYYPELPMGGPAVRIHGLNTRLKQRDHNVEVVTMRPAIQGRQVIDDVPITYLRWLGKAYRRVPLDLLALRSAILRAEVVHCYGLYNGLSPAAALLAMEMGKPYLLEPLGMYRPRGRHRITKAVYHRLFTEWMAASAFRLIATSTAEASELEELTSTGRLVVRPNGLDLAEFAGFSDGEAFRRRLRVPAGTRVILYLGRFAAIKNLEALIVAFAQADIPDCQLFLAGPAQEEPRYTARLSRLIDAVDLLRRIKLLPPVYGQEKLEALAAADLFVLPSQFESYGNAAAEATAAGVPVLLTETCGIAPLLDGRAGLAVAPTVEGLAKGLRSMLDPCYRDKMVAARETVLAHLAWDQPLAQMESIYRDAVTNGQAKLTGRGEPLTG